MSTPQRFDKQRFFDAVVSHLRSQGWLRAYKHGSGCRYVERVSGRKCAIGGILSTEVLSTEWSKFGTDYTKEQIADIACSVAALPAFVHDSIMKEYGDYYIDGKLDGSVLNFLSRMQKAHDSCSDIPGDLETNYRGLALELSLIFPEGEAQ